MQVLILGDDHGQQARLGAAMMKKGFQVICVESATAASSYIRSEMIDVLILTETRSGRISQSCACVSQSRNRAVSVIVISGRTGPALDELFEEIPQLYGVMGLDMPPTMVAALALASILPQQVGMTMPRKPVPPAAVSMPDPGVPTHRADRPVIAPTPAHSAGQGAPLSRTLIQPLPRRVPTVAAQAFAPVPPAAPPSTAIAATSAAAEPLAAWDDRHDQLEESVADIGPDLAALERELELVNRDRPSVLAATIADELPRWSQSAPKLAMLTDWTPTGAVPLSGPGGSAPASPAAGKGQTDRRLALGMMLQ